MAGFMYFVPGASAVSDVKQLTEWGIAHAFENPGSKIPQTVQGPEGKLGLMLADPNRVDPGRFAYTPSAQIWKQHPKGYWVGVDKKAIPTPLDLKRKAGVAGRKIVLGDGNEWEIPVAKEWNGLDDHTLIMRYRIMLERTVEYFDGRMVYGKPVKRLAELWSIAVAWHHQQAGRDDDEEGDLEAERALLFKSDGVLDDVQLYSCAARVLCANYVVGLLECSMLGLWTSDNWRLILNTLIDWDGYLQLAQKKSTLCASQSSSDGQEGKLPDTVPPSPTS